MRLVRCGWLLLAITLVGCAAGGPPFDELPLRDALRAEPDAVAAMPDDARARLAARFQAAGARDTGSDLVEAGGAPSLLVAQADAARQRRSADALVIGLVGGGAAQALPAGSQAAVAAALPPLEGVLATSTAGLEASALAGAAGASLRELLAASGATRLERVVGWPVAAVAMADTVYVNGAWLVALAASNADAGSCDSGRCDAGSEEPGSTVPGGGAGARGTDVGAGGAAGGAGRGLAGSPGGEGGAGGVRGRPPSAGTGGSPIDLPPPWTPPATTTTTTTTTSGDSGNAAADDGCAALADACSGADDGSEDDSCGSQGDDSSGDSCNSSTEDDGGDDCTQPSDGGDSGCQTAPGHHGTRPTTIAWLFAPLIYLWGRKR